MARYRVVLTSFAVLGVLRCGGDGAGPSLPADIELSLPAASFSGSSDGANPAPVVVQITNAGEAPLTGLVAAVSYGSGEPVGWLSATLSGAAAPATLTVAASLGSLRGGDYHGTVTVSSPQAAHGAVDLEVTFTVARAAPRPPTALTATATTHTQVELEWTDNSQVEDGFRIERCVGEACTDFAYVTGVDPDVTTYVDAGSQASTVYRYRVQAVNSEGLSVFTNVADVTTPDDPAIALEPPEIELRAVEGGDDPLSGAPVQRRGKLGVQQRVAGDDGAVTASAKPTGTGQHPPGDWRACTA